MRVQVWKMLKDADRQELKRKLREANQYVTELEQQLAKD